MRMPYRHPTTSVKNTVSNVWVITAARMPPDREADGPEDREVAAAGAPLAPSVTRNTMGRGR